MFNLRRHAALGIAAASLIIASISAAQAAGALAVGVCGAYGYGFDFRKDADARVAALKRCTGSACKIVGDIHKGCAAMAIDAKHPCGSFGWAIESHLGKAENVSVKRCYEFGGRECMVRAWACDEKG
jgi:Domain of unknown function (DUF4189)